MIRRDCFWYRPWKDMSATFDQCELEEPTKCSCSEECKWYISKANADEMVWTSLNLQAN